MTTTYDPRDLNERLRDCDGTPEARSGVTEDFWDERRRQSEAARTILREERRPEATRRENERLAELYPDGKIPDYKAPGSAEYERNVENQMNWIAHDIPDYLRPLRPFREPDDWELIEIHADVEIETDQRGNKRERTTWSSRAGRRLAFSSAVENRIEGLVAQASAAHDRGEHETGSHPWCTGCELRFLHCPYRDNDLKHALAADEDLVGPDSDGLRAIQARVRGWLVRESGRVPDVQPLEPAIEGSAFLTYDDLLALDAPSWWIDGVIPAGSYGIVRGRDGAGKSLIVQDMVLEALTGDYRNWGDGDDGFWLERGVLYCQGEGVRGIGSRVDAWLSAHPDIGRDDLDGFTVVPGCPNLYEPDDLYRTVLARVRSERPSVIVIDTLNRAVAGADQNSASDASVVRSNVHRLQRAAGPDCTVIVVGHTAKNDADLRGSSAFEDDSDFVVAVSKPGEDSDLVRVQVTKQRDAGVGAQFELVMRPAAGSVYLTKPAAGSVNLSADAALTDRVLSVLWNVRHTDPLTSAQVLSHVKDDATGKSASKSQTSKVLGDLVTDGRVVKDKKGDAPAKYSLNRAAFTDDHWNAL